MISLLRRSCFVAVLLAGACSRLRSAELAAADAAGLAAALARVEPGDTVVLADGTWKDARIVISRGGGPAEAVTIRARTPGQVILTGASSLTFAAPHVVVDGLVFRDGAPAKGDVVRFESDHGRLTNTAIVDYSASGRDAKYYYVYFKGSHNRLDHCLLSGKSNAEPVVGNDLRGSRHNTVDRCWFRDIPWVNQNGREIFRIWGYGGNEELGPDGAFFTIESNLFERAHGEGMEIISLKSNRNVVRNNTLRASRGGITNRSGNYNVIEGNFVFGAGQEGTYGIRATGQFHRITHNYVEGVSGFGIRIMSGELFLRALTDQFSPILRPGTVHGRVPRYQQPRYTTVAYNTFVDNGEPDIVIGSDYKSGWPGAQRVLLPESCTVAHNLIRRRDGGTAVSVTKPERTPPLADLSFGGNAYVDNLIANGTVQADVATGADRGFSVVPDLPMARNADGALQPTDATLAQEAAAAPAAVFSREPSPFRPLTEGDVGPAWLNSIKHDARKPGAGL